MRLAVIDCGTNTFNLIINELLDGETYQKLYKTRISVKLGEGAINKGFITQASFDRGVEAIRAFNNSIREHKVDKVLAFATSAIRDAANGKEFVDKIKSAFGIDITVIDGDREAELIYFGIREAVKMSDDVSLIIDVGGGSTEFILATHSQVLWKKSYRIGAARLLEKFAPSEPITSGEIQSINEYLSEVLVSLHDAVKKYKPKELIGSSGAFDSLVEMIHGEMGGEPLVDIKTEYEVNLENYKKITHLVKRSTLQERRQIKGLVPMRIDMIVISCVMVDFVLSAFDLKKLRVSIYSLKEGVMMDFLSKQK